MDENKILGPKVGEAVRELWNSLTDEQKKKAEACETPDELSALAAKEGVELPDEVLDAVAGGYIYYKADAFGCCKWQVISDKNGYVKGEFAKESGAKRSAKLHRYSTKEIDTKTLEKIRANAPGGCG